MCARHQASVRENNHFISGPSDSTDGPCGGGSWPRLDEADHEETTVRSVRAMRAPAARGSSRCRLAAISTAVCPPRIYRAAGTSVASRPGADASALPPPLSPSQVAEFHQHGVIVIRALIADDIVKKLHGSARDVTRTALRSTPLPPSLPPRMLQLGNPYLVMEGWQQLGYLERIVAVGK